MVRRNSRAASTLEASKYTCACQLSMTEVLKAGITSSFPLSAPPNSRVLRSEPDRHADHPLGLAERRAPNRDDAAARAEELAAGIDQGQVAAQLRAQGDVAGQRPLPA